jgi:hypothetical protein
MTAITLTAAIILVLAAMLWAAPAHTTRQTMPGKYVKDGHNTRVAFALKANVNFEEVKLKPLGITTGEEINATGLLATFWRTKRPPDLKELTNIEGTCKYDPDVWTDILALAGIEGSITMWWPDNTSVDFYGFLKQFVPDENADKELPTAKFVIVPTNFDPVNAIEVGPVFNPAPGT